MTIEPIIIDSEDGSDCCSSGKLLPIDMAIAKGLALASPIDEFEVVDLTKARGRISFDDIEAVLPLPNFNNSAMDGYAFNTASLHRTGPQCLKVNGRMAAGDMDNAAPADLENCVKTGAIRILTGALVSDRYDAVIMQEKVIRKRQKMGDPLQFIPH